MKKCIWCSQDEQQASFNKLAHTIPQSLGGLNICKNVCDNCNSFFGSHYNKLPPIETVIKETFNISRARFLNTNDEIGKNKALPRFKSIYFNVDFKKRSIDLKPSYELKSGFQEKICRQLKRGIFKMFLEERERQMGDGHDSRYDFIREFARYDLGDFPIIYFERRHGAILMVKSWATNPEIFMSRGSQFKYINTDHSFFEFELLGHLFGVPCTRAWELNFENYIVESTKQKAGFFKSWRFIRNFNDIDLVLNILNDPKG
ncbi:HNH endonuclease [Chitinophaga sp. sic0106]|uniref:HNH endonuclease n=1 Tax=Chitinophaga sp. sic0106 TaxID=2854785 RepID=UPI001C4400CE|nr:HNH endonuclease [Chitinophaga sp. sic0106]MBV7533038.1 HNH endonuclease [Chitinophaga sp. sic0106]